MNLKRKHSGDETFIPQSKIFLSEKVVENNNIEKMEKIFEKTHKMLFTGANKPTEENISKALPQQILLSGNGEVRDTQTNALLRPETKRNCSGCLKTSTFHTTCTNCNLELCEFCGYTCTWCRKGICEACIKIYSCGTIEHPHLRFLFYL
uniref:Apoptosis regulatory protein Siva n=1 Tax=Lutzomyia longipalpis TaxID=7200 RepID=A0A1B0CA90_LUTLO